jgi:hypothetical protein
MKPGDIVTNNEIIQYWEAEDNLEIFLIGAKFIYIGWAIKPMGLVWVEPANGAQGRFCVNEGILKKCSNPSET